MQIVVRILDLRKQIFLRYNHTGKMNTKII